mmetsp:Transcript_29283/g.68832  ORF Transcript_29283/g.68832 Transcript_29283/m.68832 type:complete len:392 (-) Transcript_29283:1645-2820(-)
MDSPHVAPEGSSPLIFMPTSTQFTYPIARSEMVASAAVAMASARNIHPRTRSTSAVPVQATSMIDGIPLAVGRRIDGDGDDNGTSGPTTRSRRRSSNRISARERLAETEAREVPPAGSETSRKRKSPPSGSTLTKRCRTNNRKKPPPGAALKKAPPPAASGADDKKEEANVVNCCICMCDVEPNDLASINGCDHQFCFGCIEKWSERENSCPLCKIRFTKIDRVNKKKKKGTRNSKKVKQRDQRTEVAPGATLEGLLANLHRGSGLVGSGLARIIFGGIEIGGISGGLGPVGGVTGPQRGRPTFSTMSPSDDDSEDDDSPMAALMRALHGGPGAPGFRMSTTVVRPMTVTARFTTSSRSYARNVHDSTAGNGAENPLEIDDDSVNEVIEID